MLTINDNSIIIENAIDLKEFQQSSNLFKSNSVLGAVLTLQDLYDQLSQEEKDQIYFHYYMTLNYFFTRVTSISDCIDNSKITDDMRGKVLNLKISNLNPLSIVLF